MKHLHHMSSAAEQAPVGLAERPASPCVTPGFDPGVHLLRKTLSKGMDCRVKPGNDEESKPVHDEEGRLALFGWARAAAAGLTLRAITDADLPFLARLYASTRMEELA